MTSVYIGGIEGGATKSNIIIYNGRGEKLVSLEGPSTNHWALGMTETQQRIARLVSDAKEEAGLDPRQPLLVLGLTLSGCEQAASNQVLRQGMLDKHPDCAKDYFVGSDTLGALAVAHEDGGLVLIAGTGSNALLVNPDGSQRNCGGWGHLISDEGSAFWIALLAVKSYFDDQDNLKTAPYSMDRAWTIISEHFGVKDRFGLLDHCYTKFDKGFFASVTSKFAEGARQGDLFCQWLFQQAGIALASSVVALWPHIDEKLTKIPGGLPIICVGSVWKSWNLIVKGFCQRLRLAPSSCVDKSSRPVVEELSLLRLTTGAETGAAYLAAKQADFPMPRNHQNNYQVFFHYKRDDDTWNHGECINENQ